MATSFDALNAPHLLEIEVAHVLRKASLSGRLDQATGLRALSTMKELGIRLFPHGLLIERVWAMRNNFSAYDASYIALAETLDAPLITCDRRMAKAASAVVAVEVF